MGDHATASYAWYMPSDPLAKTNDPYSGVAAIRKQYGDDAADAIEKVLRG